MLVYNPFGNDKKRWIVIGIILLLFGFSLAITSYIVDRNCMSVSEQLDTFYGHKSSKTCSTWYFYLVIIGAIIAIGAIVLLFLSFRVKKPENIKKEITSVRFAVALGIAVAVFFIVITSIMEYVPVNETTSTASNENLTIYIKKPSTILIPVRGIVEKEPYQLQVLVFYKRSLVNVTAIRLSTISNSILTYYNSEATNKTYPNQIVYNLNVTAKHNGEVSNTTNAYNLDILYTNNKGIEKEYTASFSWPTRTMDFNMLVYFFIVFIGVFVSKYTSNLIAERSEGKKPDQPADHFKQNDYIWILISGIIALLIFSSFQQQVHLTSLLITNISLSFAFGFGFDKILETGSKLRDAK